MHLQGISCSRAQCRDVMLKDAQNYVGADVFKCVACGSTAPGRDGTGPLDAEKHADDLYKHALGVLQQQVQAYVAPALCIASRCCAYNTETCSLYAM